MNEDWRTAIEAWIILVLLGMAVGAAIVLISATTAALVIVLG